jgi:hypothetical protein
MSGETKKPRLTIDDESLEVFVQWMANEDETLDQQTKALEELQPDKLAPIEEKTKYLGATAYVAGQKDQLVAVAEAFSKAVIEIDDSAVSNS